MNERNLLVLAGIQATVIGACHGAFHIPWWQTAATIGFANLITGLVRLWWLLRETDHG